MGNLENSKKTLLITGATGFLGSHLVKRFINNYKIIILKRSFSNTWRIKNFFNNLVCYDIDRLKDLKLVFKENNVNFIIHTATNYGRNDETISTVFHSNMAFPLELLQNALEFGVKYFINTDTFTKSNYGRLKYYSLSKKQFLEWLKLFDEKIKVFNMILEHVYGEADNEEKFIPTVINKILLNVKSIDFTKGRQKRDFIYVQDVVDAYEKVVEQSKDLQKNYYDFEIGTGKVISIKKLIETISNLIEKDVTTKFNFGALPYAKNEIMLERANFLRTYKVIRWEPRISLEDGLKRIIDWYKNIKDTQI